MRAFKIILITLAVLMITVVVVGLFLPSSAVIERSITIQASPDDIHTFVNSPRKWQEWTIWNTKKDETLEFSYEGEESGVGAIQTWTSKASSSGRLEITSSDPATGIGYTTSFKDDPESHSGTILYEKDGEGTRVTWTFELNIGMSIPGRILVFFFKDTMIETFDDGLKELAKVVEQSKKQS